MFENQWKFSGIGKAICKVVVETNFQIQVDVHRPATQGPGAREGTEDELADSRISGRYWEMLSQGPRRRGMRGPLWYLRKYRTPLHRKPERPERGGARSARLQGWTSLRASAPDLAVGGLL